MKITLFEVLPNKVDILNVQAGRFSGSLFHMERDSEEEKIYYDILFVVGLAALLKT